MRTFAQVQKPPQHTKSANSTRSDRTFCRQSPEVRSILHSQRMIGNQAVLRLLHSKAEDLEEGSLASASPLFTHDFSRIPVHANPSVKIQPKLTVSTPGDIYEQEADRVADQVMRNPEPLLQRTCTCGWGCPKCGNEQASREQLQKKRIKRTDAAQDVPLIIQNAIRSPGEALNQSTRQFMESQFGHDLSQVRVHLGPHADKATRSVQARAFTLGHDIVFRAGQYAPCTIDGRRLLAHELSHVVQQANGTVHTIQREASPESSRAGGARLSSRQGIEVDVIVPGQLATESQTRAALANMTGVDIVATNLQDMVEQLERITPEDQGIRRLIIYNHGLVHGQVVGPTTDVEQARVYGDSERRPYAEFSLSWLRTEANQDHLNRLRHLFCVGAVMYWTGCAVAGVETRGGMRTQSEIEQSEPEIGRYTRYQDIYQDLDDAAEHGASVLGGEFGRINMQQWANATCATIIASNDFTVWNPVPPYRQTVGYGGERIIVRPTVECPFDDTTGRILGPAPTPGEVAESEAAQREETIRSESRASFIPADRVMDWDAGLRSLHFYRRQLDPERRTLSLTEIERQIEPNVLRMIYMLAQEINPPAPLQRKSRSEIRPWIYPHDSPSFEGRTVSPMALIYPDNYWRWIEFSLSAIRQTPEYTYSVIMHELEHAADYARAYAEFTRRNPVPAIPAGDRRRDMEHSRHIMEREDSEIWGNDVWGQYAIRFKRYCESQQLPERHQEIVLGQGMYGREHWTLQERMAWVDNILRTMPRDVLASERLEADEIIGTWFEWEPTWREPISRRYMRILREFAVSEEERGRARTLLTHFERVQEFIGRDVVEGYARMCQAD